MMMVGEQGPEDVIVSPRGSSSGKSANSIVVNIQGDVFGKEKFMEGVREAEEV